VRVDVGLLMGIRRAASSPILGGGPDPDLRRIAPWVAPGSVAVSGGSIAG
jgi:hypothetical protein